MTKFILVLIVLMTVHSVMSMKGSELLRSRLNVRRNQLKKMDTNMEISAAPSACSAAKTCNLCQQSSSCCWDSSSVVCRAAPNSRCSSQCQVAASASVCSQYSDCTSCANAQGCGFCSTTCSCIPGTSDNGPVGTCPTSGGQSAFSSNSGSGKMACGTMCSTSSSTPISLPWPFNLLL